MGHVSASTLVVVGLAREARLFDGSACRIVVGGGDCGRLRAALAAAATPAITGIVSFGLAGGLRPGLPPGALLLAERIIDDGASYDADPQWRAGLREAMPQAQLADLAGVDEPVAGALAKAALFARTGAAAVDMESHVAARFARDRNLRFAAIRAVADAAERDLPPAALAAMDPDGGIDLAALARSVLRRPRQIGALIRLGREAGAGMASLKRAARALLA